MEKIRIGKGEALYIILLDSSSSMRTDRKIRFAKTLTWLLLKQSYKKKNKVSLITFREDNAQILVPPTTDPVKIEEALEKLPTGGKTPLTPALFEAFKMAKKEMRILPTIILISDGKGNVFIKNNLDEDIKFLSEFASKINIIVVNAENRNRSIGILEDISKTFNGSHFYLEDVV